MASGGACYNMVIMAKRRNNDNPARRAAERAIARAKKPDNLISGKSFMSRRTREPPCYRLRQLSILPLVVDWIKAGLPDAEVARRIHMEGKLEEVSEHGLAQEVRTYRLKIMKPGEVAEKQLSKGMVDAMGATKRGLDELDELGALFREQTDMRALASGAMAQNYQIMQIIGEGLLKTAEEDIKESPGDSAPKKRKGPAFSAQLKGLMQANSQMVKDATALAKIEDAARKTLLTSAQVRSLLGLEDNTPRDSDSDIEGRLEDYTKRRFPGRKDLQDVMLDPEKRARVMSLYQRMSTDEHLLRDLEHRYDKDSPQPTTDALGVDSETPDEGPN